MRKVCAVTLAAAVFCGAVFLCAFAPTAKAPFVYFTVFYGRERVAVTEELLRGEWFNREARQNFTGGKNLFERAAEVPASLFDKTAAAISGDAASSSIYKKSDFARNSTVNIMRQKFPELWIIVRDIKDKVDRAAYDGHILFNPNVEDKFDVVGQKEGCALDEARLCADILLGLRGGRPFNVAAVIDDVLPRDKGEVLARIGLRGGYTTYFPKNEAREHNIALAFRAFNGLSVLNGETVSFNKVVGERTRARGFAEAKIIFDGQFVPGVGGGVCQASTTIFNAVLLAGLNVEKSHNHSLTISYVPVGHDAMVSSAADLRFTNNTGGTVYIEAGVAAAGGGRSGRAFVRIYGNKTDIKYRPRTVVTQFDLRDGEIDPARESLTYIEAWKGSRLVHSKLVRKSRYRARTKPDDAAEPLEEGAQKTEKAAKAEPSGKSDAVQKSKSGEKGGLGQVEN